MSDTPVADTHERTPELGQRFRPGGPGAALEECVAAAVRAPSVHNTQPWLFHRHPRGIDVYADRDRQLRVTDPDGRELLLSVGAAVLNLRLAILRLGRLPELRLRPKPDVPDLLARVTPGGPASASTTMRALAHAIERRHSNRWPFTDLAAPTAVQAELVAAAAIEGATLRFADPTFRRAVLQLVRDADEHWRADPGYRRELATWTRPSLLRRDGIPGAAVGPRQATDTLPLRDLGLARPDYVRPVVTFEARPTIAVLYTADTPVGWLRAGQALQRVLLAATVRDLSATLLTQPLEIPFLRARLADRTGGRAAQAIIRLGYGSGPGACSPRRPVADVLLTGAPLAQDRAEGEYDGLRSCR